MKLSLRGSGDLTHGSTRLTVGTILRDVAVGVDADDDDPIIEAERREFLVVEDIDGMTVKASFVKPTGEYGWMKVPAPSRLIDWPDEAGHYSIYTREEEKDRRLDRVDLDE